jgi:hypothetical protein
VATEAAWLNGKKREELMERAKKTLDMDRPSHGRHWGLIIELILARVTLPVFRPGTIFGSTED